MMLEIRKRSLLWSMLKLGLGGMLAFGLLVALIDMLDAGVTSGDVMRLGMMVVLIGGGISMVISNAWLLIRRPLVLRANSDGVWFGAGPVIPWSEVQTVYEAGVYFHRYGVSGRTHAIAFSFHHTRTMWRLPPFLWLTTLPLGNVRISVETSEAHPNVVTAQLEGMRSRGTSSDEPQG